MNRRMSPQFFLNLIQGIGEKDTKKLEKNLKEAVTGCQEGHKTTLTLTVRIHPLDTKDRVTLEFLSSCYVPETKAEPVEMELNQQGYLVPVEHQVDMMEMLTLEDLGEAPEIGLKGEPGHLFREMAKSFGIRTLSALDKITTEVYTGVKDTKEMGSVTCNIDFYPGASSRRFQIKVRPQYYAPVAHFETMNLLIDNDGFLVGDKKTPLIEELEILAKSPGAKQGIQKTKKILDSLDS